VPLRGTFVVSLGFFVGFAEFVRADNLVVDSSVADCLNAALMDAVFPYTADPKPVHFLLR
jgi:hypothetical protein